jgi:hypothetical protein
MLDRELRGGIDGVDPIVFLQTFLDTKILHLREDKDGGSNIFWPPSIQP